MMHGREKSDSAIVAGKPTNKAVLTAAEPVERRAEAKGNASQQSTRRTQSRVSVSHALERIRQNRNENALPLYTQGGSRMPELGPYGSVRGALSNERPYRDHRLGREISRRVHCRAADGCAGHYDAVFRASRPAGANRSDRIPGNAQIAQRRVYARAVAA